ncbi:MAG: hypothetical protein HUJ90_02400, partial [Bacteroidales bacterium]|nr:hypothetical protein [Bacteroidales bacterium]
DSQVVKFSTGYEAVFAGGDNDYNVVLKRMREYMECNFCPYDVWIYDTEIYKIHE